jgi:hypothetical protein
MPKVGEPGSNGVKSRPASERIAKDLRKMAVPIDRLVPDSMNARLHPDRNIEAVMASLEAYGQVKPVVVRRSNNVVVAGNGTLEAAQKLGWTHLAATFVDLTDEEAFGYGLADNRTAELAKWNYETVGKIEKILCEAGHPAIGWTEDELEVLRAAEWKPPPVSDQEFEHGDSAAPIKVTVEQREKVRQAVEKVRERDERPDLPEGEAVATVCQEWFDDQE